MRITTLAHASVVPSGGENGNSRLCTPQTQQIALASPQPARCDPPITQESPSWFVSYQANLKLVTTFPRTLKTS